jgi:hypothetical protein
MRNVGGLGSPRSCGDLIIHGGRRRAEQATAPTSAKTKANAKAKTNAKAKAKAKTNDNANANADPSPLRGIRDDNAGLFWIGGDERAKRNWD